MVVVDQTTSTARRELARRFLVRLLIVVTVIVGVNYIAWRLVFSLNWDAWWIAVPLVLAETYSLIDVSLYGLTMWRSRPRDAPAAARPGLTVDVFITTYNEPVELVIRTARAALDIRYPHSTWVLDDGKRDEMRAAAEKAGLGYITRGDDWKNRPLHAKAGNLNNALMATSGEFLLILDADQIPLPDILDSTLGYFDDPLVALVQTPQVFGNVDHKDVLGSQAPLFYGPIQQGKDGWNAAFFCGSNAILRREALMQLGIVRYVHEVERAVLKALKGASGVLREARRTEGAVDAALGNVSAAIAATRTAIAAGEPLGSATYQLQRQITEVSRGLVADDLELMARDIEAIDALRMETDGDWDALIDVDENVDALASRDLSPLGALTSVQALLRSIDVDRADEAQPLMPLATISVTEDMATSMRLHGMGWKSAYHHETLAIGLAPEDLGTALKQRLRWAQGTMQVLLRENPLVQRGMSLAQRLMYFSTMWSYLSGFAAIAYFAAPVIFLVFGVLPVSTTAFEFFLRFLPFIVASQVLFAVTGRGISTWRGQQYSLALFPVWILACTTAVANVYFNRPLDFVVTEKTRQAGTNWNLIRLQIIVAVILAIAAVIGIVRLILGVGEPVGTIVNVVWVVFDLIILSVLFPAARYSGYLTEESPH
jgi:cellulose synthase (UDP-forming)